MHAYMIIAHNQFELLEKLIKALDDERNDIFVHIDAKVKNFDFEHFKTVCRKSRLVFTDKRINVTWGDYSQVETEMLLLKTAINYETSTNEYSYFHLISGCDLPIKSNDYIHSFLEENKGKEFIHFTDINDNTVAKSRIQYYHFFRKSRNLVNKILSQILLKPQQILGVNRLKNKRITAQKGCNWFTVTGDFARYVVDRMDEYKNVFKYSYCGDEVFIQTVFVNSPFKENLFMEKSNDHYACLRLIDWNRCKPYVWRNEDYELISQSPCLFARKFDLTTDSEIVEKILATLV